MAIDLDMREQELVTTFGQDIYNFTVAGGSHLVYRNAKDAPLYIRDLRTGEDVQVPLEEAYVCLTQDDGFFCKRDDGMVYYVSLTGQAAPVLSDCYYDLIEADNEWFYLQFQGRVDGLDSSCCIFMKFRTDGSELILLNLAP